MYDVIIVGGGPAGLSAATILGRARRRVVLFDDGRYRNEASRGIHGFLTRDGIHPAELRRIAREQLARYDVEYLCNHVTSAMRKEASFEVTLADNSRYESRKLLLATGVADELPAVDGMQHFYGAGVFHCPYCDGWELRDQPLAAYGKTAAGLAVSLKTWSDDVALCTDGPCTLKPDYTARIEQLGIRVYRQKIIRLEGGERLEQIVFDDGTVLARRGLFFDSVQSQRSRIAAELGCNFNRKGTVRTGKLEGTNVPGVYVVGDASKDVQLAIVAAAEGAKAAIAINTALQAETPLPGGCAP
jgi:thioredoxin reductase